MKLNGLSVVIGLFPALLLGQSSALVGAREPGVTCSRCTLKVERIAMYGRPDDAELIPDSPTLLRLADGRLLVGSQLGGPILAYSASGSFIGTIGRIGDGPGEYRNAKALFDGPSDSLTVLGSNSIAVISTRTGRGRSAPLLAMMPSSFVVLADGKHVINSHYGRRPAFTVLAADFQELLTFGPTMGPDASGRIDEPIYALSPSRAGGFWSAKREYIHRIERWSADGRVLQRLDSLPQWFPRYSAADARPPSSSVGFATAYTRRPFPQTRAIREDGEGRVWVLSAVADANWRPVKNVPPLETYEEFKSYQPPKDPNRHMDMIVDFFSPTSGMRLGTWRFHQYLSGFLGPNLGYRLQQDGNGVWQVELWRFTLTGN